jgi:hypothetical protein
MPSVLISFLDGEVLYAETSEITFDQQVVEAELRSVDPNNDRALFPVTAIKQLIVGDSEPAPDESTIAEWDRAAFHFVDSDVLRASISPDVLLGRHGGVWRIVEPGSSELRTLAIPYAALKGVYRIRQWDSRPLSERTPDGRFDQLARILAEREVIATSDSAPQRRALLSRMRRPPTSSST